MVIEALILDSQGWASVEPHKDLYRAARASGGFFSTARVVGGEVQLAPFHLKRIQSMYTAVYGLAAPVNESMWIEGLKQIPGFEPWDACRFLCWQGPERAFKLAIQKRPLPAEFPRRYLGMDVITARAVSRPDPRVKWCDRTQLDSLKNKVETKAPSPQEVLLLDDEQNVIEGLYSNVFMLTRKGWATPLLSPDKGLEGVAKQSLMGHATTRGVTIEERNIHLNELEQAEAIWLTNGLMGVVPVTTIHSRPLQTQEPWSTSWAAEWCTPWLPQGIRTSP